MAKLEPTIPCGPFEHYQARLKEIGRLAAALDDSPEHPMDVIIRFFELDESDKAIVLQAYDPAVDMSFAGCRSYLETKS